MRAQKLLAVLSAAALTLAAGRGAPGAGEQPPAKQGEDQDKGGEKPAGKPPEKPKPDPVQAEVEALIKQLGSEDWEKREAAQKRLLAIGKPAVEKLRAAAKSPDLEVSSRARDILAEIVGTGFLGVQVRDADPTDREGRKLPENCGAVVSSTLPDTPAAKAGLLPGDFLYSIGGKVIAGSANLVELVSAIEPGTEAKLVLYRNGQEQEQAVTVGRRPKALTETPE